MFSAVLRNAVFAPRPFAARTALALRAYSTPAGTPPPPADRATPSASSSSGRPLIDLRGARKFSPNEDPDAWWRAESAARRFGTPGNQYTGRSLKVVGGFTGTYRRLMGNLRHTGVSISCLVLEGVALFVRTGRQGPGKGG